MNYYDHQYTSNSDLTDLWLELQPEVFRVDTRRAFDFGVLFHAMLLEPATVDYIRLQVIGRDAQYTKEDFILAKAMRASVLTDKFCAMLLKRCEKEKEMFRAKTPFTHDSISFTLDIRLKYDIWDPLVNWGGDFKSTTAKSQTEFVAAIQRYQYDRARVFYSKGSGSHQDIIIGVSKHPPHRIFMVPMREGCPLWKSGEEKMNELAYKYWALKVPA